MMDRWEQIADGPSDDAGQYAIAVAILSLARAIDRLGNADAATPMGGLEALGDCILKANSSVAVALHDVAEAIRERE
jgi:hypothetical protein